MQKRWRIAGINFDHFHMGDLLRMAFDHPDAEIVGVCDLQPERMQDVVQQFGLSHDQIFQDDSRCLEQTRPDLVILCPATAEHAAWTERVAAYGVHILMEKPFASSLAEADRMIRAVAAAGKQLAINWPLRWYPCHVTAQRLLREGAIGEVLEVHYYDGNRGPLWHGADKLEREPTVEEKDRSWFYRRQSGGGSLQDYLGYGTTLGTWFLDLQKPLEVTAMVDEQPGLEVDEQSVTIVRYATGLSTFQTRWGTFSDPWTHQPQPKCGFVIRGSAGTLSSYDYEPHVTLQTATCPEGQRIPVDQLAPPFQNPVQYVLDCLTHERPIEGPLSVEVSRIGQQIVDTAARSAALKQTLPLHE